MKNQPSLKSFNGLLFFFILFSVSLKAQTLAVSPGVSTLTVYPGQGTVSLPVSVTLGATGAPVSVTVTGLPNGISVAPLAVTSAGTAQLSLNVGTHAGSSLYNVSDSNLGVSQEGVVATLFATDGTSTASAQITIVVSISNPSYAPAEGDHDLPIIRINTAGVAVVDKVTNVPGTITITSADGSTSYLPGVAGTDNTATFHVHGNSTAELPKLPYKVKLNTSTDLLNSMGIKCGYVTSAGAATCDKSKSYILLANFVDKSMLRNWATTELARAIPNGGGYLASASGSPSPSGTSTIMPWSPHSLFADVYLNGVYEGIYELIEEVGIDSHRVNITEMDQTDLTGNPLTGGYLMEFNFRADGTTNFAVPHATSPITLDDPDFDVVIPQQATYITNYVASADTALFASNYTDPTLGWRSYFDTAALADYYIVTDLMGNWDGGRLAASVFLYKDHKNPLLYFGPVWDADISAGTAYGTPIIDPLLPWMQTYSPWFQRFFSDQAFTASVATQWNALKANGVLDAWMASIPTKAAALKNGFARNNNRWPMLGIPYWVSGTTYSTYDDEIGYLVGWLEARTAFLDAQFNPNRTATAIALSAGSSAITADVPATLTAVVTPNTATGDVVFRQNGIVLGHAPLVGGTAVYSASLPTSATGLDAIYVGDKTYLPQVSSGVGVAVGASKQPSTSFLSALLGTHKLVPGTENALAVTVIGNAASTTATGTIYLIANDTVIASATLTQGTALLPVPVVATGSYSVIARYSGDGTYSASDSAPLLITISNPAASLALSTPSDEVAGTPFTLTMTAKDAHGHPASDAGGTVHVASTDPNAVLPDDSALQNGSLSVQITLNTPGTQTVSVTGVSPAIAVASAQVIVAGAVPTVTFSIPSHTFGDADFSLAASSSSQGTLRYSIVSGPATISNSTIHLTGAGTVMAQVDQTAQGIYNAASQTAIFTVSKATPSVVWHPGAITYGTALDSTVLNASATGVGGTALPGSFTYTPAAGVVPSSTPVALQTTFTPTDTDNYLPVSASASVALTSAALTITADNQSRVYGIANPSFTGKVSGQQAGDTFTESFTTAATTLSPAGSYAIIPSVTGTNLGLYQVSAHNGTLTVSQASTQVGLVLSTQTLNVGQPLVLTASVTSSSAGTPTGSIQFLDNGTPLSTVTSTGGVATLNVTTLGSGAHVLTAVYSGDTNFSGSRGTAATGTLTVTPPDFTLQTTGTSAPQTVTSTNPAVFTMQLTPANGTFPAIVTFSDSGNLPSSVTGVFSPASLAAGSSATTVTYTVTKRPGSNAVGITAAGLLLPLLLGWRRKRFRRGILLTGFLLLSSIASLTLSGCGSASPPVNASVTLTAESLGVTHTQVVNITVQ